MYENVNTRMEGQIVGFDEFMNLVLDDAHEVHNKKRTRKPVRERELTLPIDDHVFHASVRDEDGGPKI